MNARFYRWYDAQILHLLLMDDCMAPSISARATDELVRIGRETMSTSYNPQPIVIERGEGVRVTDREGRSYLDFLAGIAVCGLGHGHPALMNALREQLDRGVLHVSNGVFTEPQVLLQEMLTQISFADRVFFSNSGAEANEAAIKLARRYQQVVKKTPRFEIITFKGSFHGRTYGALSATGQPKYHAGFEPMVPGFKYADFNDLASVEALIGPHTAAIMLEFVQGEGGVREGTPEFIQGLRALCDREGILLISDEVQTGIGRTGTWFAYEHYGVAPDIMTLAKALGGGVPVGAMLATDEVYQGFQRGSHATTFGGNPLAASAGLAVLQAMDEGGILAHAQEIAAYLDEKMQELKGRVDVIQEVRGKGLLKGFALDDSKVNAPDVVSHCRARGLLCNVAGGTVLRLVPPLIIERSDVDEAIEIIEAALQDALAAK